MYKYDLIAVALLTQQPKAKKKKKKPPHETIFEVFQMPGMRGRI